MPFGVRRSTDWPRRSAAFHLFRGSRPPVLVSEIIAAAPFSDRFELFAAEGVRHAIRPQPTHLWPESRSGARPPSPRIAVLSSPARTFNSRRLSADSESAIDVAQRRTACLLQVVIRLNRNRASRPLIDARTTLFFSARVASFFEAKVVRNREAHPTPSSGRAARRHSKKLSFELPRVSLGFELRRRVRRGIYSNSRSAKTRARLASYAGATKVRHAATKRTGQRFAQGELGADTRFENCR